MDNLQNKITAYVGRDVDFTFEVNMRDDGSGPYIDKWNVDGKAKPTDAQLNALSVEAGVLASLEDWKQDMSKTDKYDPITGYEGMDRVMERHIRDNHGGIAGTPARQAEYDAKVLLRSKKPV